MVELTHELNIIDTIKKFQNLSKFSLIIRHGERERQSELFPKSPAYLTPEGYSKARMMGSQLTHCTPIRFLSSPISRCVETARGIMEGMGIESSIDVSHHLGRHGPFVIDSERTWEKMQFHQFEFIKTWFEGSFDESMILSPEKGTMHFIDWVLRWMEQDDTRCNILVSHDLIITPMLSVLFGYDILDRGLIQTLDGFIVSIDENGMKRAWYGERTISLTKSQL